MIAGRERPVMLHFHRSLVVRVGPKLAGFARTRQRQGVVIRRP